MPRAPSSGPLPRPDAPDGRPPGVARETSDMANDPSLDGDAALAPARLRCEGLTDPMCVESAAPRFSWEVCSARRGEHQTAYRLLVASSPESLADDVGDLWDSGRVASDETLHVPYGGAAPGAARRCWWKVRVWDAAGRASAWSAPATFGTALDAQRWEAQWIGFDHCRELDAPPAPFDGAQWIWLGGDEAEADAGLFVGVLELPPGVEVVDSTLALSVSGRYRFFWGPEQFARSDDLPRPWRRPYIRHMNERLGPGRNTFRVWAERIEGEPAGVLFKLTARTGDGRVFTLRSDAGWRASRVSDPAGAPSGVASWPSCRELGAYGSEPWGALRGEENFLPPPAQLRREFSIPRTVRRATLYATALGLYDLRLNGRRVHESYFDPGWTDYRKRLHYRAYDVTDHLHEGDNAWGVVLADGWYSGYVGWLHQRDLYGRHPRFRGTLRVEYEDAAVESFHTGPAWRASTGPIREADLLMGETFDARRAQTGWTRPGYDDADWAPVSTGAEVSPALHPHPAQPVVALRSEAFTPRSIAQPEPGVFVFDLGQNFAGVVELRVRNAEPGREITIRHGERLRGDGTLYTRNLRTARATDTYICRGDPEEAWSPRFTFHGFQYVEVTGLPHEPDADTLTGLPLSSDTPLVGGFECSDPLANRLARNVYWSQRSNFIDIPTDCPQRDERLGWCDAAWTFLGAGALRADVQQFYNKWMRDLDDAQHPDGLFPWLAPLVVTTPDSPMWIGSSPGWADAGVICPWEIYHRYADRRQLQEHYPNMVRQVEWYRRTSRDDLLPPPGHACLGDWLNENAPVPLDVFRTAFFAHSADLTARAAQALGKSDDARRFRELHRGVAHAFRHAYVHEDGTIDGDTPGRLRPRPRLRPPRRRPAPSRRRPPRPPPARRPRPAHHRPRSHPPPHARPQPHRPIRPRLPPAPQRGLPLVELLHPQRRDHHLGTVGQLDPREGLRRRQHELLQPLLPRGRLPVDGRGRRRHPLRRLRLPTHHRRPRPRRQAHPRPRRLPQPPRTRPLRLEPPRPRPRPAHRDPRQHHRRPRPPRRRRRARHRERPARRARPRTPAAIPRPRRPPPRRLLRGLPLPRHRTPPRPLRPTLPPRRR